MKESSEPTRTAPWWRRFGREIVAAVVVVAALAYLVERRGEGTDSSARGAGAGARAAVVTTAVAQTHDIAVVLEGLGSVTPLATVTVRSRVDGELVSVLFREGQDVEAGDALAEIDPRPFQVQRSQAEGQLARDQALLANARLDLERYRVLYKQDSVAKQQLDSQESLVRQYEAAVKLDQAQVDDAALQLVYCHITAPIKGRLGLRTVDAGNLVLANDAGGLVTITQMQPITVVFTIAEDRLPGVLAAAGEGRALRVEAWDRELRRRLATGVLTTIDNQIDPNTGTVRLKAEFPNEDEALFPNQFVNARLFQDVRRGSVVIPSAAVQRGAPGTFVYVVKADQTAEVRPVRLGVSEQDRTEVEEGLGAGEVVVVEGGDGLHAGGKVEVRTTDAAPSRAAP